MNYNNPVELKQEIFWKDANYATEKKVALTVAIIAIIGIGCILAAYFLNTPFHNWFNNHIVSAFTDKMSIEQGLLKVGLPVAGGVALIGFGIFVYKRYKLYSDEASKLDLRANPAKKTLYSLKPNQKQVKSLAITLGILAILGAAGALIFLYCHPAHQWLTQQGLPILKHQLSTWQITAYVGGGALGASAVTTAVAIALLQKCGKKEPKRIEYDPGAELSEEEQVQ